MKQNPFKYGELSTGDNFCNRQAEIKRLHNAFRDGQSIVLISPRRWGKSSLVDRALDTYKRKVIAVKMDCFGFKSSGEFFAALLKTILTNTSSKLQQVAETVKENIRSFIPYINYSVGEADEIKITLELPKTKMDVAVILDLPQKIAAKRRLRIVVCIDEFQQIAQWPDGQQVLESMRKAWQKHKEVSYCLYGSKRHLMSQLFTDKSQPFFNFGETIFLPKIERGQWIQFLLRSFRSSGVKIDKEVAARLTDLVDCHSYFIQYLARICWNNAGKELTMKILDQSYEEMLNDNVALFQSITRGLTQYQVNYLRAVVAGETQLTSTRVLSEYNLGSPGNIQRIAAVMEDAEILDYSGEVPVFCDPYFRPLFERYFANSK
ncbi:MAG: ATP-binding protein [Cyclobacteriaceae bacterium]